MSCHRQYNGRDNVRANHEGRNLRDMTAPEMPKGQSSFRLSDAARARLVRAARRTGSTQTQVIEEAITHYLATLEKDQPIWREVPSERALNGMEGD